MKNRGSFFQITQRSSRLVGLAAALLLAVLVGGLVTGLILVRSHGSATAHPKQTATSEPTQTPGSTSGVQGPVYIQMLDATHGWAITSHNHVLRTTDGANHWQDVTPQSLDTSPPDLILTHDFLSASVAWVTSSVSNADNPGVTTKSYRTTDGGKTWHLAQSGIAGQVIFTDSQHGWMLSGTGVAAGSEGVDVYRTTDGGATWTKVASANGTTGTQPGKLPFSGTKSGIGARDAMTAWVTGSEPANLFVYLYVTHDGGKTWQHQTLPIPSSIASQSSVQMSTTPPTFFNAQDGILPVVFAGANGSLDDVYVTHDGGATWQSTALVSAFDFDFFNATQGYATDGSTLYATSDGGQHWTKLPADPKFKHITVLNFVSNKIGWAIDNPLVTSAPLTLLKTTDGGKTWTVAPFPTS